MPSISNLACATDFDKAYVKSMYQQHSDVIGVATVGVENATDNGLRDLAIKIRNERMQQNQKLQLFARTNGMTALPLDYNEVAFYRNQLYGLAGQDFNVRWANLMLGLLQQSEQAAQMAATQATDPDLRNQGSIVAKASANEIDALRKWLAKNNIPENAITPPCPTVTIPPCVVPSTTTTTTE